MPSQRIIMHAVDLLSSLYPIYADDGIAFRRINENVRKELNQFIDELNHGGMIKNPCLCKSSSTEKTTSDIVIAHKDKYGLPARTVLCRDCHLVRIDPYMTAELSAKFYNHMYPFLVGCEPEPFFNVEIQKGRDIASHLVELKIWNKISSVCEIGCGPGGILFELQRQGKQVLGFDYNQPFIEYGKTRHLSVHCENALESTRYEPEFADLLILNHVVEHIVDARSFVRAAIERVVKPNGFIYFSVPGIHRYPNKYYRNNLGLFFTIAHPFTYELFTCLHHLFEGLELTLLRADEEIVIVAQKTPGIRLDSSKVQSRNPLLNLLYLRGREKLAAQVRPIFRALRRS